MGIFVFIFVLQVKRFNFIVPEIIFLAEINFVRKFIVGGRLLFPQVAAGVFVIVDICLTVIAVIICVIIDDCKINAMFDFGVFSVLHFDGNDTGAVLCGTVSIF